MEPKDPPALAVLPGAARDQPPGEAPADEAGAAVTALYRQHALGLTRLAHVMLGAEDVVHEAFYGLYRRRSRLKDPARAPQYLRSSVLNGCRTQLRRPRLAGPAAEHRAEHAGSAASAESDVLAGEDRQHERQVRALDALARRILGQQQALDGVAGG